MLKKEFKVYSPLTRESVQQFTTKNQDDNDGDSERILLEGIASTTNRDLQDEIVSPAAIETMAQQAEYLNIHANHWYGVEDVVGAIKESKVEDGKLHIKFLITKKYTPDIRDLLDTGVRLGLSIGGAITNYDEKNRIINELELYEISLTPMPANWDTFGTVTTSKGLVESNCLTGACYAIVKTLNNEEDNMETKNETHKEEEVESSGLTQDEVIALINEYMAEKEETIAQEITDKVESQLEAIVDSKIKEALDEEPPAEEDESSEGEGATPAAEGEAKATEPEEDDDDEEPKPDEDEDEDDESAKSVDIADLIKSSINEALGDDFADKVAAKMWGDFDRTRTTKGSKYQEFQEAMKTTTTEPTPEPVEKTTYSTKEAAEILLKKQKSANPIMAAAMKNLE